MRTLNGSDLGSLSDLLARCSLPFDDLKESELEHFVGVFEEGALIAAGGLELYGPHALLRSVSVTPDRRGRGLAGALVEELEKRAREKGVRDLFLLTETAETFFARRGYDRAARDEAPDAIASSSQFSRLCPQSATLMRKRLFRQ